ncbi:MAG: serine/threonine-protein kinase [Acidobacteriota bacterium]
MPSATTPSDEITRWRTARDVFLRLLDEPTAQRRARLRELDDSLRARVEALLDADHTASEAVDAPVGRLRGFEPLAADTRLGPWHIESEIGRGGHGVVYAARRAAVDFEQRVALKVLAGSFEPAAHQRFALERRLLGRFEHPSIVGLIDGGTTDDGLPYVVMDFVDGLPVDRWCDERRLDVHARLRLVLAICHAVEHAHRRLVVHRDLKPSNILVDHDGLPRLVDFGIARMLGGVDGATATRGGWWSPGFTSPEVALQRRSDEHLATTADVYSLGAVLHVVLAGVPPSSAVDLEALATRRPSTAASAAFAAADAEAQEEIAAARATSPRRLRAALRGDLDAILARALEPEPARRYGSVGALRRDLERHLDGHPVTARRSTIVYRVGRLVRRHRLASALAAALLAVVLAFAALSSLQARRLATERDLAERERARAEAVGRGLIELVGQIDPYAAPGLDQLALELMHGGERVADQDQLDLEIRLRLWSTIARGARLRGDLELASRLAERAVQAAERELAPDDPRLARARVDLIVVRRIQGRLDEALEMIARIESEPPRAGAAGDAALAHALWERGAVLIDLGRFTDAALVLTRTLEQGRRAGFDAVRMAALRGDLAAALRRDGFESRPDTAASSALDAHRGALGSDNPTLATDLVSTARQVRASGSLDDAEELLREALGLATENLGDEHEVTALAHHELALVHRARGDERSALPHLRAALAARRATLGDAHWMTDFAALDLGSTELALGLTGARDRIDDAAERLHAVLPSDHWALERAEAARRARTPASP